MIPSLTPTGALHALLALSCIVIGAIQLSAAKNGVGHRARGYAFVYAMLVADASALALYRFNGAFNMFHVGAIANFACIVLAMIPVLRSPRASNWKRRHYYFIAWSYVSLLAAAASEVVIRGLQLPNRHEVGLVSFIVVALATAAGYRMIERHQPTTQPGVPTTSQGAST
jgi:uncharacterized membrane protein